MKPAAEKINQDLQNETPALWRSLSELGREAAFPPDIPFQAQQAKGTTYNGTIGVYTDGAGNAVPLPSMAATLNFEGADRNRAFLYSPVGGIPEVRERWRAWQRRGVEDDVPSSMPLTTMGLTHSLALAADLFGGPGHTLAVAEPFWGNYRQVFKLRTGAEIRGKSAYVDGAWQPDTLASLLRDLPDGDPAMALLNFPSNPGGYAPNDEERGRLKDSLLEIAEKRPLVVLCDDAYAGFVYPDDVSARSMFWDLAGAHEHLTAVKIDGATKEFALFGGRVGFITFGVPHGSPAAAAMESKIKCLIRAGVGSPGATAQMVLLEGLRSGKAEEEIGAIRAQAKERWEAAKPGLAALDSSLVRCLPFNAGFFALLELNPELELDADAIRLHLIENHDTGVVSIGKRYLRIATCSVKAEALPEMIRRVEQGIREKAGR